MNDYILEVCVDSAESALAALAGAMGPENQTMAAIAERFPDDS